MHIQLNGKRAFVSGATQGIGKAIAIQLAKAGASVTICARNEQALKQTVNELDKSHHQEHSYLCADFSRPDELRKLLEAYNRNFPVVNIVVNNTGGPSPGSIVSAQTDEFLRAFQMHLICNHIIVQNFLPSMISSQYGRIINIISTSVKQPLPNLGVSNTIRAAVANWAKTLANEVAVYGITVNNILPGATRTQRLEQIIQQKAQKSSVSKEIVEQGMNNEIPMRRFAMPEEPAYLATFLASPYAAYITGVNIPVDGGRTSCL
ncbi:MAG: short-chain dehydrogenase [Bacteroidia bacterium]|nr:MAG: short-chain dehydrogenase [Bacteroidia bacterium]